MDLPRQYWLRAWPVYLGMGMTLEEVPREAFFALYADPEEAEAKYKLYQARRDVELSAWRWNSMPVL